MPDFTMHIPTGDIKAVNNLLDGWVWLARDLRVPLKRFGVYLTRVTDKAFEQSGRPPGSWRALSPMTLALRDWKARKKRGRRAFVSIRPLVSSGNLRRSFNSDIQKQGMSFGTNIEYAGVHQIGGTVTKPAMTIRPTGKKKALKFEAGGEVLFRKSVEIPAKTYTVPKREMLRWLPEDTDELERVHEEYFNERARQFGGRAL